jgi:hypothetical protein
MVSMSPLSTAAGGGRRATPWKLVHTNDLKRLHLQRQRLLLLLSVQLVVIGVLVFR